jgi:hypothetical protein
VTQLLPYLLLLVCPLTMGVMMWAMMRGMGQGHRPDPRLAELESQVNELRAACATGRSSPPVQERSEVSVGERP